MLFASSYTYENEARINIDLICSICLDPFQLPICDIHCGHIFCFRCVRMWLKQNETCPICRQYFTKFTHASNKILIEELDYLPVKCRYCNQTNIKRGDFDDHLTYECSKPLTIDYEENQLKIEKQVYLKYLLRRVNEIIEIRRSEQQNSYQDVFSSIPLWIVIMSCIHMFAYMAILFPIGILLNVTDGIIYILHYILIRLIHITGVRV